MSTAATIATFLAIAGGIAAGEVLALRIDDEHSLPLMYAVVLVATRVLSAPAALLALAVGEVLVLGVRLARRRGAAAVDSALSHTLAGAAGIGAAVVVMAPTDGNERLRWVLASLAIAAIAMALVDLLARSFLVFRPSAPTELPPRFGRAWLVLGSCGALMALAAGGVDGRGGVGVVGSVLCGIPLLAAWWSFQRLAAVSDAHRQTLEALAMAPELAGVVPDGHARRVAALAGDVAREIGLPSDALADLEAAALLHHLGAVTAATDAPPRDVARRTAALLRPIASLERASGIVANDRAAIDTATAAQILDVCSRFDDHGDGDQAVASVALDAVTRETRGDVDLRVLEALERVVAARR